MKFLFLAEDEVHAVDTGYLAGLELGVAAGDDEDGVGVLAPDTVNHLPVFVIGRIGNGACVNNTYICRFALFSSSMTALQQRLT